MGQADLYRRSRGAGISPGLGQRPPPTCAPATGGSGYEAGAADGVVRRLSGSSGGSWSAAQQMRGTSRASSMLIGGRMPGMERAMRVLPAPGGPTIKL